MLQKVTENVRLGSPLGSVMLAGDPGCDGYNVEAVVVLEQILRQPADLHLLLGDLVPVGHGRWFEQFAQIVSRNARSAAYCLPGNHDLPDYAEYCGQRDYFIKAPNALFVILDNARRYFTAETVEFLRRTLAEEAGDQVFVAFHIPPPNPFIPNHVSADEWEKIRSVLEPHRARIRMIFAGHVHSAFDYRLDGYRVVVTGGAGARLDPVENTCLSANGHHAFRLDWLGAEWRLTVMDIDHDAAAQVYGPGEADRRVLAELAEGFAGEALACRKYQLFSERAEAEGYPNVARLFRAAAESEFHHSRNMFLATDQKRSTLHNLTVSLEREAEEVERIYPASLAVVEAQPTLRAGNAYACALHAEKVHHRLFGQALACLREGRDLPAQKYFTCLRCGYTHAGDQPPTLCPACGTDRFKFAEVK